jgi:hypothetical protein
LQLSTHHAAHYHFSFQPSLHIAQEQPVQSINLGSLRDLRLFYVDFSHCDQASTTKDFP